MTADIEVDTLGTYSPPDWQNTVANTTPEYTTYSIALNETQPIHITSPTSGTKYQWTDTNKTVTGDGFEATQSTGKLELWSDLTGTIKVSQDIDTWSATSIQFDLTKGTLVDGVLYLVVTNASAEQSGLIPVSVGFGPYAPWTSTDADLFWTMDNTLSDEVGRGGSRPLNNVVTGTPAFVATPICRSNTHSFQFNSVTDKSEIANSDYTNITNLHTYRNIGGWINVDSLQETPGGIYEEGGGVNNIYMLMLPNGRLMANVADSNGSPDFKAQAYSDFSLVPGRSYHVIIDFQAGDHFTLWIDGIEQALTAGVLGTDTTMSTHSGDWSFGDTGGSLDTGGIDVLYTCTVTLLLAQWGTWSGVGGGSPLSTTEIRDSLFREGALAEHVITSDTEVNMQDDIDDYDSQTHADEPLTYYLQEKSGGGDLELTITDQIWPDEVKFQILWASSGELTVRNSGTSNFDSTKAYSPVGGTFAVIETAPVKVAVTDIDTGLAVSGAMVRIEADTGGPLTAGVIVLEGTTDVNGELEGEIDYTSTQPIIGKVRKSSASPFYKTNNPVGIIDKDSRATIIVGMISDE